MSMNDLYPIAILVKTLPGPGGLVPLYRHIEAGHVTISHASRIQREVRNPITPLYHGDRDPV